MEEAEGLMPRPGFRQQLDVLVERNMAVHAGSAGTLLLLFAQAPIIGYFIGLAWKGQEAAPQTYFIMAVAALWMGCMNACTAVVQERSVFRRERMFSLNIGAYLLSKLSVLAAVCAAQTVLLLIAQAQLMHLKSSLLSHLLLFLILSGAGLAASGLGLLISCFARTSYGAVVCVPIVLIPQVLFSEILLQGNIENAVPALIEKLTITKWCFDALTNAHNELEWLIQLKSAGMLLVFLAAFLGLSAVKLRFDEV